MSLDEKVAGVRQVFEELWSQVGTGGLGDVVLAWSGGKDSTLLLRLWLDFLQERGVRAPVQALSLDTGLKFPEVLEFRDRTAQEWGVEVVCVRPDVDVQGYPAARNPTQCCYDLKIAPLKRAILEQGLGVLLSGVRRDEHPNRADREYREQRHDPEYTIIQPMLDFTEADVWSYLLMHGVPYCRLYEKGYRSLGCRPCTVLPDEAGEERSGRSAEKERAMESLRALGYF